VTRRVATSAFALDRSINRCKLRALRCWPAFDAVKMRCRSRRTSTSTRPQSIWSQSSGKSRGPFTVTAVAASNVPADAVVTFIVSSRTHLTRVGSLSGRAHCSYPAGLTPPRPRGGPLSVEPFPSPFGVPAFASRAILFPGRDFRSPHGRPTSHRRLDPDGISTFHMRKTQTERAPSIPRGRWCSPGPRADQQPASAASQRQVPNLGPVPHSSTRTFNMTRHQPRVHPYSPARPSPHP
jgi:hypothetical protein